MLKDRSTYEIMTPETIGLTGSRMVLGRHTGRHGFAERCKQLGYKLNKEEVEQAYQRFVVADEEGDLRRRWAAIINDQIRVVEQVYVLEYLHAVPGTGTRRRPRGMKCKDEKKLAAAFGDGPVDAAYEAIRQAIGLTPELENYSIRAVTSGKEALGEATVRIRDNGRTYIGRGVSTDIIEASAKAYVDAINRMVAAQSGSAEVKVQL
jgi:2-isopropylmalate synthase